jgi:hypothetical protein
MMKNNVASSGRERRLNILILGAVWTRKSDQGVFVCLSVGFFCVWLWVSVTLHGALWWGQGGAEGGDWTYSWWSYYFGKSSDTFTTGSCREFYLTERDSRISFL